METGLILIRFVHYGASLVLFGLALFPLYAYSQFTRRCNDRRALAILLSVSLLVLFSGVVWFIVVAASMTDAGMSWEAARLLLMETSFGGVSLLRLGVAVATVGILALQLIGFSKKRDLLVVAMCAILLGSLAGVGHTQMEDGQARAIHTLSDVLHLLGAGAWLGGLAGLLDLTARVVRRGDAAGRIVCEAAFRFSRIGYPAVAVLVASGLVNSLFLVGSLHNLLTTMYGLILVLKLVLFAGMAGLAGHNRFVVVPTLLRSAAGAKIGARRLLINVAAEQSLGLAIILIVGLLGVTEPAGHS